MDLLLFVGGFAEKPAMEFGAGPSNPGDFGNSNWHAYAEYWIDDWEANLVGSRSCPGAFDVTGDFLRLVFGYLDYGWSKRTLELTAQVGCRELSSDSKVELRISTGPKN